MEVTAEVPRPHQVEAETQDRGATADLVTEAKDVEVSRKTTREPVDEVTEDEVRGKIEVKTGTVHIQKIKDGSTDGKDGNHKPL